MRADPDRPVVRAAGGVVWRPGHPEREVAIVHRPRYDDWSLPKGKLDPGESWQQAAVREVAEETGLAVTVEGYLGQVAYPDRRSGLGAHKVVRFWAMRAGPGSCHPDSHAPDGEVDAVRWLPAPAVPAALTYPEDRDILARFLRTLPGTG